jgi:hypothetical protein
MNRHALERKGWLAGEAKARWMRVAVKHCAPVVSSDSKSQNLKRRLLVTTG